jgi:hypothetical protein
VLPSADTAAMLFWALLASGQINMRKDDGWQTKPMHTDPDLILGRTSLEPFFSLECRCGAALRGDRCATLSVIARLSKVSKSPL